MDWTRPDIEWLYSVRVRRKFEHWTDNELTLDCLSKYMIVTDVGGVIGPSGMATAVPLLKVAVYRLGDRFALLSDRCLSCLSEGEMPC